MAAEGRAAVGAVRAFVDLDVLERRLLRGRVAGQAFGEQGYKSNMSDKRRRNLRNQQGIGNIATKKVYKTTLGVRYFVSYGRSRGHHLAPGIWAASGTHDVQIKPVLMFVRPGNYRPLISMDRIAQAADLQDYLDRRVRARVRNLAEGKPA